MLFVFMPRSQICEKRLLSSSCLPVRPPARKKKLGSHWTDFHEIWYLRTFRDSNEKIQVSLKSEKNKVCITWSRPLHSPDYYPFQKTFFLFCATLYIFWSYLTHFFLEWEMFKTKVVEKIKTHILCSVFFF